MDTSPITTWTNVSAYYTFANHEGIILAILAVTIAITFAVIGGIMRHEMRSEAGLIAEASVSEFQASALASETES